MSKYVCKIGLKCSENASIIVKISIKHPKPRAARGFAMLRPSIWTEIELYGRTWFRPKQIALGRKNPDPLTQEIKWNTPNNIGRGYLKKLIYIYFATVNKLQKHGSGKVLCQILT